MRALSHEVVSSNEQVYHLKNSRERDVVFIETAVET